MIRQLLLLVCLAASLTSFTQKNDDAGIISALQHGDAAALSSFFDTFIDLKLPAKDEIKNVGKTQASITVKSFFEENKIAGFELISQRELSGTTYIAGKLTGSNAKFNLTLMMKKRGDKLEIITVRIS